MRRSAIISWSTRPDGRTGSRSGTDGGRGLGRLSSARQRAWTQIRAIRRLSLHSPRTAGDVVSAPRRMGRAWRIRPRKRRGWRRTLAVRAGRPAGWLDTGLGRRSPLYGPMHAVPPSRLLPRHGPGVGMDGSATRRCARCRDDEPVRLHRCRNAGAEPVRARHACRCEQEGGSPGARECRHGGSGGSPDSLAGRGRDEICRARSAARTAL